MNPSIWVAAPLACLTLGAILAYLVAHFISQRNELLALLTATVFAATLVLLAVLGLHVAVGDNVRWGSTTHEGGAFLYSEPGSLMMVTVAAGLGLLVTVYSGRYLALVQR